VVRPELQVVWQQERLQDQHQNYYRHPDHHVSVVAAFWLLGVSPVGQELVPVPVLVLVLVPVPVLVFGRRQPDGVFWREEQQNHPDQVKSVAF